MGAPTSSPKTLRLAPNVRLDFLLEPAEYEVRAIGELRREWRNVPDRGALNLIAVEAQYLEFHRYLLESLRHCSGNGGDAIRIGLSVRAGALKSPILLSASIAEAALRSHAERRGYPLPNNPRRRTFGRVLGRGHARNRADQGCAMKQRGLCDTGPPDGAIDPSETRRSLRSGQSRPMKQTLRFGIK